MKERGQEVWYIVNKSSYGGKDTGPGIGTVISFAYSARIVDIELRNGVKYLSLDDGWGGDESEFFATKEEAWAAWVASKKKK